MQRRMAVTAAALLLAGAATAVAAYAWTRPRAPAWALDDPAEVALGRRVYAGNCASCHGDKLQGQPRRWQPGADGRLPAPPHDPSGHTWQHSDTELHELVAHSVYKFAAPDYRSAMPAFEGRLSEREISATIAYIKSTWPPGVRAYQAAQNSDGPSLAEMPGDWHFPATCNYHLGPRNGS